MSMTSIGEHRQKLANMRTQQTDRSPEPMWARRVTLSGPSEALDDRKITIASSLFAHFSQQDGHLGGHLFVQREKGCFCATSFWADGPSLDRTMHAARSAAKQMCTTIWGRSGRWELEVFEVIGLKPALKAIAIPQL